MKVMPIGPLSKLSSDNSPTMKKLTRTELILGALLAVNLVISFALYQRIQSQDQRLHALERDDAVKQEVQSLNSKYNSLKSRIEGLFH
jgi:hypothetical protein